MLFVMDEKEHKLLFNCVFVVMFYNQWILSPFAMWVPKIFE